MRNAVEMILRCRSLGMVGADVLDGVYGSSQVFKRLRLMRLAASLGRKTRVFGSSWSPTPAPEIVSFLRQASWLELHARDPISWARMEATLDREVRLVADLAFLLKPELVAPEALAARDWLRERRAQGMTLLGVNLSGHTIRTLPEDGLAGFATLLEQWLEADAARAILVMPHDSRPGMVGDAQVLERLNAMLSPRHAARLQMLPATLDAWELKALCGELDLILTGRMHLAIAAMGMGTPPLCTVYQGKFEGLMAHFELKGLTMQPAEILSPAALPRLEMLTSRHPEFRAAIRSRLPAVLELSRLNLAGMSHHG